MYYINNVRTYMCFSIGKSFKSQILSNLSNKSVNLLIIRGFSVTRLLLKIGC